ncbi:MAG: GntR family transcriptional regulator [Roseibium sp.]|uniref:GntR family transcriptional regulator n=1 Tax=Roseibium sp. TaxID=1936156 RepID=UPI002622C60F|nr:GntR family transcriptional regulator [Roseibium sp.]MCV0426662.1 GntR family transcriptional regulator [Roseibium sp.]
MDSTTIKRPAALSEGAADAIRNAIIQGEFGLGEALPEVQLTRRLGISKTPIREGLSLLSREGLVTSFPQRGFFVFTLKRECVTQLCDFRHAMETLALDMALRHNRDRLIADLEAICAEMQTAHENGNFKRYLELDTAFHAAFFDRAENPYVKASYQMAASKVATIRTHLSRGHLRTDLSLAEHTDILHALKVGKDRKARAVLKKQIYRGEQVYEELVTEPNG